jgi:hypothetical protein
MGGKSLRQKNMVMDPMRPRTKNGCGGESQQQFTEKKNPINETQKYGHEFHRTWTKNDCACKNQQQFTKLTEVSHDLALAVSDYP